VLDVALRNVSFRYPKGTFSLRGVSLLFPKSTHTAIVGPPACGASTLLRLIAGTLKPDSGDIIAGSRVMNSIKPAARPLLFATSELDAPGRWSVQHALVAAVSGRTLDREDRHREYGLAVEKWGLAALLERRLDSLSSSERVSLQLARIELLRPAVLVIDRLLEALNPSALPSIADELYRTLRVMGATVISAPSSANELGLTESVIVLDGGRIVQQGSALEVFATPRAEAAAMATGEINVIPIEIRGGVVESVIGSWSVEAAPFEGRGVALVRPGDFHVARPGEDSDLIFGVEEASFREGRWSARGLLTGGVMLRVSLPREEKVHKGRLLALRFDPTAIRLIQRDIVMPQAGVPTDVLPSMRDSR
jgi:ABC-type sugar transport system ATPase subunit